MDIRSIFESVGSDDPIRSAFESVGSNSFDEQKFRSWYAAWAKKAGIDPDPDNPEHYYDYRAAFSAGVEPSIDLADKQYHWPSQFKKEGHPRMVLDGVNTKTGQPVDPIRSAFEAAAGQSGPQLGPPVDVRALRGEPTRTITDAISAVVPQEPANQSFARDKPVYTEPKLSPRPANAGGPQLSPRPPQIEPKKAVDQSIRQASADTLNFLKALKAKEVRALEERLGADDPLVVKEKAKVWDDSPLGKFQKRLEVETTQDPLPRPEGFKGYVQDMVRALPQVGASVGATYIGGPAAGMAATGSMIAGATERELSQARVDGKGRVLPAVKDPERRWKAAIFNAAGQSFLEQFPISRALAAWKPGAAAKSVIAEMSKTGALEWFIETIQKVPELMSSVWARGAGKSPDQMLDEFTEGVGQALKEGAYEGAVVAPVSMLIGGGGATMGKIKAGPQPIQADEIETPAQAKAYGIVADKDMTEDLKAARADAVKQRDRLTDLEEPYQDEIAVADLDNKIGLYDEALRNADNMQKVRQAFEDAARRQPEDIGSQIVENEPQTEERLTDEPQQPPTLPEDQRTSEQPGEPAASGPGQQFDPVRSAFEAAAGADAAVPTVPDLATTEDAISFGEAATDQQVSELGRLREQTKARLDELNAVPVESRDWNAVSQEAFKSQLYREAIEASRGEHPSQLEAGRPMYWDGDGKTQLSAEDAPAGTVETDQPPQLTDEQRQAVQKIYGAEIPILRTVFGKDLADRISVELKQMIDLGGANTDESLANWKARGVKPNTVLGATTFRGQRALMEISLAQDAKRQQWTFDHETFHIAAEWVLPPDQYATVLKAYGGNTEAAADGFARFMNGKSQPPEGIKKIFMQLKELLRRMGNFLRGSGFTSADKIFGDIAAGGYAGKRRAGTGMYQGRAMSAEQRAPAWYSQMQKVFESKLPGSGTPAQIKQAIDGWAKKGEFKAEELEWSGVKEWLDQQTGKVTKQQVLDFVAANNVQIKEVVKDDGKGASPDELSTFESEDADGNGALRLQWSDVDSIYGLSYDGGKTFDMFDDSEFVSTLPENDAEAWVLESIEEQFPHYLNKKEVGDTKFSQYQLPGGENYKEVLLTLPKKKRTAGAIAKEMFGKDWAELSGKEKDAAIQRLADTEAKESGFRSSHWDEPNVLAHVRFNERTGPNGERILFLEEVQSDWMQAGRKKGFKNPKIQQKNFATWLKDNGKNLSETEIERQFKTRQGDEITAWQQEQDVALKNAMGVPDAPFKKTWPMLAFKRMVRYAAENGFDSIAWTTGDVQAERYDLSKQVRAVEAGKNMDGLWDLAIEDLGGNLISGSLHGLAGLTEAQLENHVGKDLAQKIINREGKPDTTGWHRYEGVDLKVGGEGMKGFYDKILPAEVNAFFGKKVWGGAKVGTTDLRTVKDESMESFMDWYDSQNPIEPFESMDGEEFNAMKAAWLAEQPGKKVRAHSLPITPQMRDKALHEGMTLFNLDADNPGGMPPREPYARRPKSKNAIELPELTEMIKVLNSGRAPKLFQRMRDALGLFQHNDLAGIADVMIDPDLVIGQPIERAVIRLKGKTPAERKVSLVQQMQDFKDSVLSRYNVDPADMVFKSQYHRASGETHLSAIRKDPDVAAKVLSRELGHLDDWWAAAGDAPMVQGRGNILGRIAKLKGYINEYLAEYPGSPDEALTAADIGRLKKEAAKQKLDETTTYVDPKDLEMSGVTPELILDIMRGRIPGETSPEVYRFLQTVDTQTKKEIIKQAMKGIIDDRVAQSQSREGRMPTQKEINERFKELLRKEIIKRKLYERMVIMDELKNLTQEWKPFDLNISKKYTAYRHKSSELYADAVSVMLQEPELLKSVAPTFDKAMKMYASVRPDFTETLEGIRKDISGSQIGPRRLSKLYEMYERGEKVIADFYIRNRMEKRSLADTLFLILTDRNHGVLKQIRAAEKSGDPELIAKARKARYELEETQYIASEMSAYVTDTVKNVIDPMMEKGATITDLGAYLFGRHVQANRKDMVSPGGHTSTTVEPMLEALEQKLGPEKYQAVKDAAEKYRKIREKYIIPRIEQSGIASPELLQTIKTRGEYARISVQHWLEEKHGKDITAQIYTPVGGALKAQKGTFSDSINAFTATLMQDISLLRSAHLNKAKTDLLDFLIDAGQVKPAEMKYDKGLGRMAPVRLEDPSRAYLSVMRDGEPFTYDVHRDIAKSFEYSAYESQKATEVINALNAPLRRLLVSNNPVWMIRNIFRDFRTTIKNIPEARVKNLPELAKLYKQAYGEVWEYVWKNNASDDIDALLRGKAITTDRVYGTKEMGYEDETARIADEFNVQFNPELSKISQQRFRKARQILDVLDRFGRVSELGGKVAGYKFLKSQRDKGFVNPKTGKPRTDQEIYHVVRSRIGTPDFKRQGTGQIITNNLFMFSNVNKEGLRSALESFNEDRSAYVWKTVMYNILPKLILAAASAQIPWVKEVVDGLTDYQKDHYTVIPIPKRLVPGLGAMDSFAFLIPEDYEGQLAGALVNKIARGEFGGTKGAINEASQLVPYRWHPAISVGADLLEYYVNGMNPVDDFRGSHILPDSIYKAGGFDAHKEMGKYVWNNLGMRMFYNAKQGELDPELAPLKEALQFPVLNWLSAIATVTNRGHAERYRRIIEPIRKEYARKAVESEGRIKGHINLMGYDVPRTAKVELYKALKQEDLLPPDQDVNAFEKRYNRIKNKGRDDQRIVLLEYAVTNEEKAALLSQYEMELGAEQYKKLLQNLRRDGIISQETLLKKARGDKNGRNRRTNP